MRVCSARHCAIWGVRKNGQKRNGGADEHVHGGGRQGNVLVQNRLDPNWSGIVYPGGHVEVGESITASVIREIREETGLTIENPTLCGVKQFWLDNGVRYIVFLFRADKFTGELHGSEGDAFWLPRALFRAPDGGKL